MTENKKTYVSPKMQVFSFNACSGVLMTSESAEKHTLLCPYIPETRCYQYHEFIKRKIGTDKFQAYEESTQKRFPCPYKNSCEDYDLFCKITNERQR